MGNLEKTYRGSSEDRDTGVCFFRGTCGRVLHRSKERKLVEKNKKKKTERMTMNLRGNKHLFVFGTLSEVWEKTLLII